MTLQQFCSSLSEDKQIDLAIKFVKLGLPIWDKYTENKSLIYIDSIVALHHSVDKNILLDTIIDIESYIASSKLSGLSGKKHQLSKRIKQFSDPIVALQDDDWKLPEEVVKIFYSVHNLLEATLGIKQAVFDKSTIYTAINQAIDGLETAAILTTDEIKKILDEAKKG